MKDLEPVFGPEITRHDAVVIIWQLRVAGRGGRTCLGALVPVVIATARKIACRVYRLLKYGEEYVRQEMAAYEAQFLSRTTKGLAKKARALGYKLVPVTEAEAQST